MKTLRDVWFCAQLLLIVFRIVGIIHWPMWLVLMPVWLLFVAGVVWFFRTIYILLTVDDDEDDA